MNREIKESSQNQPATAGQNVQDEPTAESRFAKPADAALENPAGGGSAPSPCSALRGAPNSIEEMDWFAENPDPNFLSTFSLPIYSESDFPDAIKTIETFLAMEGVLPLQVDVSVYRRKI